MQILLTHTLFYFLCFNTLFMGITGSLISMNNFAKELESPNSLYITSRLVVSSFTRHNTTDQVLQKLAPVLKQCTTLQQLELPHNSYTKSGLALLLQVLDSLPCLTSVDVSLSGSHCTPKDAQLLLEVLKKKEYLKKIDMRGYPLNMTAAVSLQELIKAKPGLSFLAITVQDDTVPDFNKDYTKYKSYFNNYFSVILQFATSVEIKNSGPTAELILEALKNNSALTTLVFSHVDLADKDLDCLSQIVQTCTSLSTLQVDNNSLSHGGLMALLNNFRNHCALTNLKCKLNRSLLYGIDTDPLLEFLTQLCSSHAKLYKFTIRELPELPNNCCLTIYGNE